MRYYLFAIGAVSLGGVIAAPTLDSNTPKLVDRHPPYQYIPTQTAGDGQIVPGEQTLQQCTPYDTLKNPSFNRFLEDWTIDPSVILSQNTSEDTAPGWQILGIYPYGFEDGQIWYSHEQVNANYDNSRLRAAYYHPQANRATSNSAISLSQYIAVCPGMLYHFELGVLVRNDTGIAQGDCLMSLQMGPDAQVSYDWVTDLSVDPSLHSRFASNAYTATTNITRVRISFACQDSAFLQGKDPMIFFDSMRLYPGAHSSAAVSTKLTANGTSVI